MTLFIYGTSVVDNVSVISLMSFRLMLASFVSKTKIAGMPSSSSKYSSTFLPATTDGLSSGYNCETLLTAYSLELGAMTDKVIANNIQIVIVSQAPFFVAILSVIK